VTVVEARGVSKVFGGVHAVRDCSVSIGEGEIVGLIGPNGAGKTTLFNILCGLVSPTSGTILVNGKDIAGLQPHDIARLGAVKTFQIPRGFETLSVLENLVASCPTAQDASFWRGMFGVRNRHARQVELARHAMDMLRFLNLASVAALPAGHLSGGQRKLLDLGRALMLSPNVLMLDEPLAGVSPVLAEEIAEHLAELRSRGISIALIEHRVEFVRHICDRIYVLSAGSILTEGRPEVVLGAKEVVDAFLGVDV
jgi:ABC-type branched-subunit amino acid transport system ATPase component